jgi:cytochrome c553
MRFYRDGARANPVMVSVAGSLNDEQIKALATYFGSLPKPSPRASPPAADKKTRK